MAIKLYRHKGDNGRWGYVDEDGDWVIKPRYTDAAEDFCEGLALVRLDEKSGFIDQTGKEVVPCIYDYAWDFCEGFARVELDDKRGYIKPDGSWLVKPKFDDAEDFSEGFAAVKLDGKWGYIKSDGKWLVKPRFYDAGPFEYGIAVVEDDDFYVIDKTGKRALARGEKLSLVRGTNGLYGLGVIYDESETESRIRWVIKPRFDKGFEWDSYIVVREEVGLWGIIGCSCGAWEGHYDFIEENDDDYCLDCYSDDNVLHFYPDGIRRDEDEDDNEYEDDDE